MRGATFLREDLPLAPRAERSACGALPSRPLSHRRRPSPARLCVHRPYPLYRQVDNAEQNGTGSDRDEEECRTQPRDDGEHRERKVDDKYRGAYLSVAPTRLHHPLIGVRMVRVIPSLTMCDATTERHRRIEHERAEQQNPDKERHCACVFGSDRQNRKQVAEHSASDVAHEKLRRCPVEREESGARSGDEERHHCQADLAHRQQNQPADYAGADRFTGSEAVDAVDKVVEVDCPDNSDDSENRPDESHVDAEYSKTQCGQSAHPEHCPARRHELNRESRESGQVAVIVDPADGRDHRAAAGERYRQIPVEPAKHGGDDDSTERRNGDGEPASARCRRRVRAPFVRNVEQPVERVESHATRQQPAQNRGCNEKNELLDQEPVACDRVLNHSAVRSIPISNVVGGTKPVVSRSREVSTNNEPSTAVRESPLRWNGGNRESKPRFPASPLSSPGGTGTSRAGLPRARAMVRTRSGVETSCSSLTYTVSCAAFGLVMSASMAPTTFAT